MKKNLFINLLQFFLFLLIFIGQKSHAQLNGTYTINSGGTATATNYLTVSNAVSDLMSGVRTDGGPTNGPGVSGSVTLRIVAGSGPYTEQVSFGAISGTSATNFVRLTGGPTREEINFTATTTTDRHVIRLSGTKNIILDSLTLVNNGATYGYGVWITNASDSNWITNSVISVNNTSTSSNFAGITISGSTPTTTGNHGNYNTIMGNVVSGGYYGFSCNGTSTTVFAEKNKVINNEFKEFYYYGIRHYEQNNGVISGNTVHARATGTTAGYGMYIYYNNNNTIEKNKVYGVGNYGLYFAYNNFQGTGSGGRSAVRNNMIGGTMLNTSTPYGIYMTTNTTNLDVFHNSISLTAGNGRCIYDLSGSGNDIRNNSFSIINSTTGWAAYISSTAYISTMNYNNYYAPGSSNFIYVGVAYNTGNYHGGGGFNVNSRDGDPNYFDPAANLHAFGAQLWDVGDPSVGVTDDFDGDVRPNPSSTFPDIGADEFQPNNTDMSVIALLDPVDDICPSTSQQVRAVIQNLGINTINSTPLTANITGAGTATLSTTFTGSIPFGGKDTVVIGTFNSWPGGTFNIRVYSSVPEDQDLTNDTLMTSVDISVPPAPPVSSDTTICTGSSATLTAISTGTNYWYDASTGGNLLGSGNSYNTGPLTSSQNFYVEARGTASSSLTTTFANNNSCGGGNMFDITAVRAVKLDSFDLNMSSGTATVNVYYKVGTHIGFETNAGAWTLLGSATVTSSGTGSPTRCVIGGLTIPAGQTYGIYVNTTTIVYTTLTSATTYSTPEMSLTAGTGLCGLFSGTNFPRGWNGTVYYTFEGCPSMRTQVSVTVEDIMVTGTQVEPTTCFSTDGSIDISVSGGTGPFTYAWTGPGVVPNSEDQTNLTVGSYTVTVTSAAGCVGTASFALAGPGGCICPTISSLTSTPSGNGCINTNITLDATGLADMGTAYGITFKYSTSPLADPYVGGTIIATVPNSGLTAGGTAASTTTTFATANTYYIYAVLSPTPPDPTCRPSQSVTLPVYGNPSFTSQPVNRTICSGQSTTFAVTTSGTPVTYQWQIDQGSGFVNLANVGPFSGVTTATLTITGANTTYNGNLFRVLLGPCGGAISNVVTLTVNPLPTVTVGPNGQCAPVTLVAGGTANTYSWSPATGLNTTTGTTVIATPAVNTTYTVTGTITATGCTNSATVNVLGNSTAAVLSGTATICNTQTTNLVVTITGGVGPFTVVYNNGTSNVTVNGYTSGSNIPVSPSTTTTYTLVSVTGANGCAGSGINTTPVTVTVNPLPTIAVGPNNQCSPVTLTATGNSNTYSWSPSTGLSATTGATVTATTTATITYTVTGTITATGCQNSATVTVLGRPNAPVLSPTAANVCLGGIVQINATATPTATWSPVTGLYTDNTATTPYVAGTQTNTVYAKPTTTTTYTATSTSGSCSASTNIVVTVTQPVSITTQPANSTVCAGANATFSVVAAGNLLNYQWQVSTDGGVNFTNLSNNATYNNVNTATLNITGATTAMNNYRYRVVISNSCGTVTSNSATLTVTALPVLTVTPLSNRICLSDSLISLVGTPVGGVWSGIGVYGNTFIPMRTAVGTYTLTYTYTANNCTNTATVVARVEDCPERIRELGDKGVLLYPNPNDGHFSLRINSTLYNYLGMRVYTTGGSLVRIQSWSNLRYGRIIPVDLSKLTAGVYQVRIYYDDGARTAQKVFNVIITH